MKKLISALTVFLGLSLAMAQQVQPKKATPPPPPPAKVVKVDNHKKEMPAKSQADKKVKTVAPQSANSNVKLKADGTPDKRYKANKHLKADGTPDKRYKENQK